MTTTTLIPVDLSDALVAALKADATLVTQVGEEIREESWMGDDFVYPAVRVDVNTMPIGATNGVCHGEWFDFNVSVYVFTNQPSSRVNQQIMGTIGRLFQNNTISTAGVLKSQPLNVDHILPIAIGQNFWRGEVLLTGQMKEL